MPGDKTQSNLHATGLVLGSTGIVVMGGSGSGKTALALELINRFRWSGGFACLVSDDQLLVCARSGRLLASAPAPIAGLAEFRGFGVALADHEPAALVDLVVDLIESRDAPRYRRDALRDIEGIQLPCLDLPMRHTGGSARAVLAWIAAQSAPPLP